VIAASISDYRELARRRLPHMFFEYIDSGSYAEATLRANLNDMSALKLRQRVMCDVSKLSLETTLLGRTLKLPVALGPVGFAGAFSRRGEAQAARAARAAGVPFCLSTVGICSAEEVSAEAGDLLWFQLYMLKDRAFMASLLDRVAALGVEVLIFTVDLPVAGTRYRDARSGMNSPGGVGFWRRVAQGLSRPHWSYDVALRGQPLVFGNLVGAVKGAKQVDEFMPWIVANMDASVTWRDIAWVRERWKGKIIIKGVLDPDDAEAAIGEGADALVVSNHGGRQLDGARSSISALPRVAERNAGRVPILFDGGVRSGLDVLRALALGAQVCLLGRAWAFALAGAGEKGVAHVLDLTRRELSTAMALTGLADVRHAGPALIDSA
jgi:L-lactate dehydrogenase (cytochrome)